ncbi:MAG: hypothetical protein DRJ09_11980, partial [Bacteroidetes bacterium]
MKDIIIWKTIEDIIFNPENPNEMWISIGGVQTSNGSIQANTLRVLHSTNGGNTWYDYSEGLSAFPVMALEYQAGSDNRIFAGTDAGVFYRDPSMNSWKCFSHDLPTSIITDLDYNPCNKYLYASAYGRSLYKSYVPFDDNTQTSITNNNEVWNTPKELPNDLVIKTGSKLTISENVYITAGKKIIIEPGAKLIVDGGTLTNGCGNLWEGIEVWGNTTASQYPDANGNYAQGMLVLKNGATIENAVNAITNWKPGNWSKRGGIVYADNTNFINNRRSAEFMQYQNFDPATGDETNYKAHFTKCSFVYNDEYINNPTDRYHVTMWGVNGIKFKGCTFTNEISSEPNTGYGIYTIDAGFTVTDFCDSPNINCPNGSIHSSFKGFLSGIESSNPEVPYYLISVFNSDFQSNAYGIKMTAVNAPVIVNNNIEPGIDYGCNNNAGYGIYFDNCKIFAIENNHFTLSTGADPANYEGIHIMNTNNNADQVYNNTFDDVYAGNVTQGKNWNGDKRNGLVFTCNKNQNNQFDFFVNSNSVYDGIQQSQGGNSEVTGNTFSANADNFINKAVYDIDYYYNSNVANENPVQTEKVIKHAINLQNDCVNHYGDDIRLSTTEYQQKESDYNTASASYNNAVSQYDAANDSAGRAYWSTKISYYNQLKSRSAYDIIRSDMADTIAHPALYKTWMEKLNTYSSTEALVDYYLQQGDYTTALNKVDSMAVNFTFTAYDSVEYPLYKDFKQMQAVWMADNRTIFDLNTSEINGLISIADSSKGIAGAQARSILLFAYNTLYSYSYCPPIPGNSNKSAELGSSNNSNNSNELTVTTKPNPAGNTVTFSYTLPAGVEIAVLSLYSANGKLIYKHRLNTGANKLVYN